MAQSIDLQAGIDCTSPNGKHDKQKQIQKTKKLSPEIFLG